MVCLRDPSAHGDSHCFVLIFLTIDSPFPCAASPMRLHSSQPRDETDSFDDQRIPSKSSPPCPAAAELLSWQPGFIVGNGVEGSRMRVRRGKTREWTSECVFPSSALWATWRSPGQNHEILSDSRYWPTSDPSSIQIAQGPNDSSSYVHPSDPSCASSSPKLPEYPVNPRHRPKSRGDSTPIALPAQIHGNHWSELWDFPKPSSPEPKSPSKPFEKLIYSFEEGNHGFKKLRRSHSSGTSRDKVQRNHRPQPNV